MYDSQQNWLVSQLADDVMHTFMVQKWEIIKHFFILKYLLKNDEQ
jgi:hypothetical protein